MPKSVAHIFRFRCVRCNHLNAPKCEKCGSKYTLDRHNAPGEVLIEQRVKFGKDQWERVKTRAKLAGVAPTEYVRLATEDMLHMPTHRLMSSE